MAVSNGEFILTVSIWFFQLAVFTQGFQLAVSNQDFLLAVLNPGLLEAIYGSYWLFQIIKYIVIPARSSREPALYQAQPQITDISL